MAQAWELALQNYKTDTTAASAEIARAQAVYTAQKAAGNMAGADAAHVWANQIRDVIQNTGQPVVVPTVTPVAPVPTPAPVYTLPPVQPTVIQPYVAPAPATPTGPAVAANQVAQTAYYQAANALANDSTMMTQFLKENPWANPDNNQWDQSTAAAFSNWSDSYVQQISAQSILDGVRFDATKEPWWPSYVDMLTSRDALTKASLKTALDLKVNATQAQQGMATAEYNFQVAEIDNALNLANWATKEEMATGNVWMAGALNWAVAQNETQGLNQKNLALQQRGATIAKLANDITILTSDYANQGTLMDAATIAEIGAKREYFLSGNIEQYNTAMALVKTLQGAREALNISAPGTVKAGQAAEATATQNQNMQTAAFLAGLVQQGIYLNQNPDGTYGYKTGLTADQQLALNTQLFQQWYQTQGLNFNYAQLASDQTQYQFTNWLSSQNLDLAVSAADWGVIVDKSTMVINQQNADTATATQKWSETADAASWFSKGYTYNKTTGQLTYSLANDPSRFDALNTAGWLNPDGTIITDVRKNVQSMAALKANGIGIDAKNIPYFIITPALSEQIRSNKVSEAQARASLQASINQAANALAETIRSNKAAETAAGGTTNAPVYDPTDDRALVNSANFMASGPGSAPYLRLGAYSGAMVGTEDQLKSFVLGGTSKTEQLQWNPDGSPKTILNKQVKKLVDVPFTGLKDLDEGTAMNVINVIPDPVRAGEVWSMYCSLTDSAVSPTAVFRAWAAAEKFTPAQLAAGLAELTKMGMGGR